jgi:hypothetical protein
MEDQARPFPAHFKASGAHASIFTQQSFTLEEINMMSWPDQEPRLPADENRGADEGRDRQRDADHEFLSVTMRIWVVTLFVLALPVLAIATLHIDPTEQVGTFEKQNCQSKAAAIQSARAHTPRRGAAVSDVADRMRD